MMALLRYADYGLDAGKEHRNVPANTTVIAALSTTGMTAPMLVSGATDHHVVEAYVEHVLGRPRVQL